MKNILAENMFRFGTKNLTESQKRQLRLLMTEAVRVTKDPSNDAVLKKFIFNWYVNAIIDPTTKKKLSPQDDTLHIFDPAFVSKDYIVGRGRGLEEPTQDAAYIDFNVLTLGQCDIANGANQLTVPYPILTILRMTGAEGKGAAPWSTSAAKYDIKFMKLFIYGGDTYKDYPLYLGTQYLNGMGGKTPEENIARVLDQISTYCLNADKSSDSIRSYTSLIAADFSAAAATTKKATNWQTIKSKMTDGYSKGVLTALGY